MGKRYNFNKYNEEKTQTPTSVVIPPVPTTPATTTTTPVTGAHVGTKYSKYTYKRYQPCHKPTEVFPGMWLCSLDQALSMTDMDILVPLHSLDGDIWKMGFRGEIHYVPIIDYGTLPADVLKREVDWVIDRLIEHKKLAVFCFGGHGRTGYFASAVLGKLANQGKLKLKDNDPIAYLHEHYCKSAVEDSSQVKQLAKFLNNRGLIRKYKNIGWGYGGYGFGKYGGLYDYDDYFTSGVYTGKNINKNTVADKTTTTATPAASIPSTTSYKSTIETTESKKSETSVPTNYLVYGVGHIGETTHDELGVTSEQFEDIISYLEYDGKLYGDYFDLKDFDDAKKILQDVEASEEWKSLIGKLSPQDDEDDEDEFDPAFDACGDEGWHGRSVSDLLAEFKEEKRARKEKNA